MSVRSDGIEAYDRGDDFWIDNPYEYGDKRFEEWVDGWRFGAKCDLDDELQMD